MSTFLFILSMLALVVVAAVLAVGIYSLLKGGRFAENWSNKLMRLRVMAQAFAIVCLCAFAWWQANH